MTIDDMIEETQDQIDEILKLSKLDCVGGIVSAGEKLTRLYTILNAYKYVKSQLFNGQTDSIPKSAIEKLKTDWENEDGNHCSNWDFVLDLERLLTPPAKEVV